MNTKLQYYYEDIDNIFDICKEKFNYNNFAVTSKKQADKILEKANSISRKLIEEVWENTEEAVNRLTEIQLKVDKIVFTLRMGDEMYKNHIYQMSQGTESDSTKPYEFKNSDWKAIITTN